MEEFEAWKQSAPLQLSHEDRQAIEVLAEDLPALWHAKTTKPQARQQTTTR